jgi:hypothetical protein
MILKDANNNLLLTALFAFCVACQSLCQLCRWPQQDLFFDFGFHFVACAVVIISNFRFVLQIRFICRSASLMHVLPVKSLQTPLCV